uniref:Cystatin domain-containing protein n=1 Tax=Globodera rostochiensis TaxID=31243 RepID=A0A914H3G4_GLORO
MAVADQSQQNSVVGGWTDQDVAGDSVKTLASRSIISAQSQVVAGLKYKLRIVVGRSNCPKSPLTADFANCAEGDQSARKTYLVTIWQKPWEHFEQITYEAEEMNNSREENE